MSPVGGMAYLSFPPCVSGEDNVGEVYALWQTPFWDVCNPGAAHNSDLKSGAMLQRGSSSMITELDFVARGLPLWSVMNDLLQMLNHYRAARSRIGVGRGDEADRTTVLAFGRLIGDDPPWHGVDPVTTRPAIDHPVTLALPMGFVQGTIRALTGAGVLVALDTRPGLGTRCVVRIDDADRRHSYLLPAVVSMVEDASLGEVALIFDGPCDVTDARLMRTWPESSSARRRHSRMPPAA